MKRRILDTWVYLTMISTALSIPIMIMELVLGRDYKLPWWVALLIIITYTAAYVFALVVYDKKVSRLNVKIKYFTDEDLIRPSQNGDLIDLRAAEDITMKKDEFKLIPLGVAMALPLGYKANVYPRSSTYKNFRIILANSVGQIDNRYRGDGDQWYFPAIALEDTFIAKGSRICQFEIVPIMDSVAFHEVDRLEDEDRGGIGSTGTR